MEWWQALLIFVVMPLLCGWAGYKHGYEEGFDDGYNEGIKGSKYTNPDAYDDITGAG
jgi:hypothetical protein